MNSKLDKCKEIYKYHSKTAKSQRQGVREKLVINYKGTWIWSTTTFWAGTMEARRQWYNILKVSKEKNIQSRILYSAKLSFKNKG